jgi:hypothetical protein
MASVELLTEIFGWCSLINMGILTFASLVVTLGRDSVASIHARMFELSDEDLSRAYIQYLAQYKIAIFIFNLTPYLALKLVA